MALIDDIIDMAADDKEPIGNLLRKCLILERQIRNDKFRAWLDSELDGYENPDELPSYRVFNCVNKGMLIGNGMTIPSLLRLSPGGKQPQLERTAQEFIDSTSQPPILALVVAKRRIKLADRLLPFLITPRHLSQLLQSGAIDEAEHPLTTTLRKELIVVQFEQALALDQVLNLRVGFYPAFVSLHTDNTTICKTDRAAEARTPIEMRRRTRPRRQTAVAASGSAEAYRRRQDRRPRAMTRLTGGRSGKYFEQMQPGTKQRPRSLS